MVTSVPMRGRRVDLRPRNRRGGCDTRTEGRGEATGQGARQPRQLEEVQRGTLPEPCPHALLLGASGLGLVASRMIGEYMCVASATSLLEPHRGSCGEGTQGPPRQFYSCGADCALCRAVLGTGVQSAGCGVSGRGEGRPCLSLFVYGCLPAPSLYQERHQSHFKQIGIGFLRRHTGFFFFFFFCTDIWQSSLVEHQGHMGSWEA